MIREKTIILWNKKITSSYYNIGIKTDEEFSFSKPGQFIMLSLPGRHPFLRRPFSIHRLIEKKGTVVGVELLYKVVGELTGILAHVKEGEPVDLLGPLGNGFLIKNNFHRIFIVAGGIGVAPMLFFALHLRSKGFDLCRCTLFIGGRSQKDILCADIFADMGVEVEIATEDGTCGKKGLVTDLLNTRLKKDIADIIFACGPVPMLKQVAKIARLDGIKCQISTESVMACGVGACLGCAVKVKNNSDKYMHVCVDGPVFDSTDFGA